MVKIYGHELRLVALRALESGQKRREVSAMLGVSIPTLDRWLREYRQQGQNAARPRGHKRRAIATEQWPALKALVESSPDATVGHHLRAWEEHTGQCASLSSLRRTLKEMNWSFKKRVFEPASETKNSA